MKKHIPLVIFLVFFGIFCAAVLLLMLPIWKKADPIVLPEVNDIVSIDVTIRENRAEKNVISHTDSSTISALIMDISEARPTRRQSVHDTPTTIKYIKLDIHFSAGIRTLFVYEENGRYYIEQPYQGIYEIDDALYAQLQIPDSY